MKSWSCNQRAKCFGFLKKKLLITKCRPQTADLENTDLENTDLKNTDLENTDFKNTDLENADLENADLENIYLLIEKLRPFILKGKKKISKSSKLLLRLVQVC